MNTHKPFVSRIVALTLSTSLLILTACQESPKTSISETEIPTNVTTATVVSTSSETSQTTTAPSTTSPATTVPLAIEITLERLDDNFVFWNGVEITDYPSHMYNVKVAGKNPSHVSAIEELVEEKLAYIKQNWALGKEQFDNAVKAYDASDKTEALENNFSSRLIIQQDLISSEENGIITLYSSGLIGNYASEPFVLEPWNIFVDQTTGQLLSFDDFLSRNKLDKEVLSQKTMEILSDDGYYEGWFIDSIISADDINEKTLFYNGTSLILLIENKNPQMSVYFPHEVDLGPIAEGVAINYGQSGMYSSYEIDDAVNVVLEKFSEFDGCTLYSLTYAGDKVSRENLEYSNSLADDANYVDCMVLESSFRSPKDGGGSWKPDTLYTWSWYLAREKDGDWVLLSNGYT